MGLPNSLYDGSCSPASASFEVAKSNLNLAVQILYFDCTAPGAFTSPFKPLFFACGYHTLNFNAAQHRQAWHFIMLSSRGRIMNDERQGRRKKTNSV